MTVILTRENHLFIYLDSAFHSLHQDCLSPSLMHLDVGEVDLTSFIHVPAMIVPSHAPTEDPSDCAGHAAAVPSRRSSVTGRDDCTGGSGIQMGHVSSPRGLVGLHLLGASQVRWSSAGCSIEALHAQGLIKIDENCPGCSISGPSSTRQVPVVSEILPEICSPMPDTSSGALGENYDESHGFRGSWREIEACPLAKRWTATPATKSRHYLCRSPNGQFRDADITASASQSIIS